MNNQQKLKKNDVLVYKYYVKVDGVKKKTAFYDMIDVTDLERGQKFQIIGDALVVSGESADYYNKEEKKTKVQLAEMLANAFGTVFTVCFNKQDGEERVLRGYLLKSETGLGRSVVVDLDIDKDSNVKYDNRQRQVDHRTLKYIIMHDTKYVLK